MAPETAEEVRLLINQINHIQQILFTQGLGPAPETLPAEEFLDQPPATAAANANLLDRKHFEPFFDVDEHSPRTSQPMSNIEVYMVIRSLQKPFHQSLLEKMALLAMYQVYDSNPQEDWSENILNSQAHVYRLSVEIFRIRLELLRLADNDTSQLGEYLKIDFPTKLEAVVNQLIQPFTELRWFASFQPKDREFQTAYDTIELVSEGQVLAQHIPEPEEGDVDDWKPLQSPLVAESFLKAPGKF